jgi:hypothetical protein
MAYDDGELRGIGGWLAFFLITLGVITPLRTVFAVASLTADSQIAANLGELRMPVLAFEWSLAAFSIAAAGVAVWHFFNVQHWRTVRFAIGVLWLFAALSLVVEPLGVSLLTGVALGEIISGAPAEFIQPLIYSSIWTAYLLKSERVANTYPRAGGGGEVAEVFE